MTETHKKARWLFPTNTNNLRMILAQGLIASPEGFSKYYKDLLEDHKNYLPLFNGLIPEDSLEKVTCEGGHLTPCLLELDLAGVSGLVDTINNDNKSERLLLESIGSADIKQILIPLPIPLNCISKVIFKDKADVDTFKKEAETRSNVILNQLKLQSTKADTKLFTLNTKKISAHQQDLMETNNSEIIAKEKGEAIKIETITGNTDTSDTKAVNYKKVYAFGGLLMSLFYYAKNGELSQRYFSVFSSGKGSPDNNNEKDSITPFFHSYFHNEIDESRPENKLLMGIFSCCMEPRNFKDSVINFLQTSDWEDKRLEKRSRELAEKLNEYATQNTRSVSEWFNSIKSDNEKILLMLFTREDTTSLIDYENKSLNFSEQEYLFFALFFGIRDGFIKTPPFLKKYNNLQKYISHLMAVYAHKCTGSGITFKSFKSPPLTVWQYVDKKLSTTNVKTLGIESSVQTIMPKADFHHEQGKNIYIGYIEPKYEVNNKNYFNTTSRNKITDAIYNKLK